jgi:hypothetical protein
MSDDKNPFNAENPEGDRILATSRFAGDLLARTTTTILNAELQRHKPDQQHGLASALTLFDAILYAFIPNVAANVVAGMRPKDVGAAYDEMMRLVFEELPKGVGLHRDHVVEKIKQTIAAETAAEVSENV